MKKLALILGCAALSLSLATNLVATDAKSYQVTGPVLEVNDGYIVVQKGEDKWQIARNKSAKGAAVKVGDKVTVQYQMVAVDMEVKMDKADKAEKPKKAKKE